MPTVSNNSLIIQRYEGFGGNFVDSQYLGAAYATGKPHEFERVLRKTFASHSNYYAGKNLLGMVGTSSVANIEIDDEVYRYSLTDAQEALAVSLGPVDPNNTALGLNNSSFEIELSLDFYERPDVLMGENSEYPIAVLDSRPSVNGTIYKVKLSGDDPTRYFPSNLVEVGKEFSKTWTELASEGNQEFGTQQTPSSFKLENQIGTFGQEITITDKALRQQGRMGIKFLGAKGKVAEKFLPTYEAKMYDELYMGMEAASVYGIKGTRPSEYSKYWIKTGDGIRRQLKDSWNADYAGIPTEELFKDFLLDISVGRINESEREFNALTGTAGSIGLHSALAAKAASFLTVDTNFIKEYDRSKRFLSYGAQFTHYVGSEGIRFSLTKNGMNDSLRYEKRRHPIYNNLSIDSGRYTFLNFGMYEGKQNIAALSVKDTFTWGMQVGLVGPNGPMKGDRVSVLKNEYSIAVQGTRGVVVFDPTSCGEIKVDIED